MSDRGYQLSPEHLAAGAINISNGEFLGKAFLRLQRAPAGEPQPSPLWTSFPGDPKKGNWSARALQLTSAPESPAANNYFTLAAFIPDGSCQYRRKKECFAGLFVVALDDVTTNDDDGPKAHIPFARITLPPSYVLETSAGNYQVGYFLSEPVTNVRRADELFDAVIAAGLSDPGASGPAARLMRLPVGCNGKHSPAFTCRLRLWAPDVRYSADELAAGLGIFLGRPAAAPGPQQQLQRASAAAPAEQATNASAPAPEPRSGRSRGGSSVFTPAPSSNPVLAELQARSMIKKQLEPGKFEISCPWHGEHSDALDTGAAYFEPDAEHPRGGFKCLHGHCADRGIGDLLKFLGLDPEQACMKPRIHVIPGEIDLIAKAAERVLAETGSFYCRGSRIVRIARIAGDLRVEEPTAQGLMFDLNAAARWDRHDARAHKDVPCDPPEKHVKVLLDLGRHELLPELVAITRQPALGPDGEIFREPGYCPATKLYGDFDGRDYAAIPAAPNQDDAKKALQLLEELLDEFEFEEPADKSAALAAILTATVRGQLRVAPMFHVTAHLPGSGKSYLTSIIAVFATPGDVPSSCFPREDEECRKLLHSLLMTAPQVIVFDNMTSDLYPFKSLCTAITEPIFSSRVLRSSRTVDVSTRTLLLSSGNNVEPVEDMTRRAVTIKLSPQSDRPAEKTYRRPDLLGSLRKDRPRYIGAALTVMSAWLRAGKPRSACRPVNSFLEWSDLCRQPLLWLGLPDPAQRLFEAQASNADNELVAALFGELHVLYKTGRFTVHDIAERGIANKVKLYDCLAQLGLADNFDTLQRRQLGWWLKKKNGWIAGGMKLIKDGAKNKMPAYRIEQLPARPAVQSKENDSDILTEERSA